MLDKLAFLEEKYEDLSEKISDPEIKLGAAHLLLYLILMCL